MSVYDGEDKFIALTLSFSFFQLFPMPSSCAHLSFSAIHSPFFSMIQTSLRIVSFVLGRTIFD